MNTSSIQFQCLGWHAEDVITDETEPAKYIIKIFGKTADDKSVSLSVKNFTPYFYLKIPSWNKNEQIQFYEFIREKLPVKMRPSMITARTIKKKDFWGFTNGTLFNFLRLTFLNVRTMRYIANIFEKPLFIPRLTQSPTKFQCYEANIDPYIRFMHIADIQPCGWITLEKYNKLTDILPSISTYDLETDWKNVKADNTITNIAPFKIAAFDIECTSSSGEFPVAKKTYKPIASQIYELYKQLLTNGSNEYNLKNSIQHALGYSIGVFSELDIKNLTTQIAQHYTKEKLDVNNILEKIKIHIDEIYTILGGKFKTTADEKIVTQPRDKIINTLTTFLNTRFPPLEGDPIIQIGTTVHKYGEQHCYFRHIITLGSCDLIEDATVVQCKNENELLLKWRDLMIELDPDILTGYNIFGFDFSYMYDRSKELGIQNSFMKLTRFQDRIAEFKENKLSSSALGDNILKFINMEGRILIDLMKVVQRDHKLDSYKLDNVAEHFLKMNKHDVSPSDIFMLQKGGSNDRKIIANYCLQDCSLCNSLMMKLEIIANNMGMANVCSVPLSFIFMRGQGIKIFSLVMKQCREEGLLIPVKKFKEGQEDEEDSFEGAIVLEPKEDIYINHPVSVLDYASLYPSSMISENLSHDMLVLEEKYNNLPGIEYLDISYDIYDNNKNKVKEQVCRFVQPPNQEKGVIPNILMKLLKARGETRKRMKLMSATVINDNSTIQGYIKNDTFETDSKYNITKYNIDDLKDIEPAYTSFQIAVLDGLQNAYKITANSLYGQLGAKTSQLYLKEIAACTTATGRKMILMAKDFLETNYNADVVYGDSVTGYTPIIIKQENDVRYETIESVAVKYGNNHWRTMKSVQHLEEIQPKEYCEMTDDIETWTDNGWTKLIRVIRHKLAEHKNIIRVLTHTGVVDVTDDHSLLTTSAIGIQPISPKEICIGTDLLHYQLPEWTNCLTTNDFLITNSDKARIMGMFMGDGSCGTYNCKCGEKSSWAINNSSMELLLLYKNLCEKVFPSFTWKILNTLKSSHVYKLVPTKPEKYGYMKQFIQEFRSIMYYNNDDKSKIVPHCILSANRDIREAFWQGLYDADGEKLNYIRIDQKSMISAASIYALGKSLGYSVSINARKDKLNIFRLTFTKGLQRKNPNGVKKIITIPSYQGYVYDLTTENHHFAAGVGQMIVSNTDSIFVIFPNDKIGKDKIMPSIHTAITASTHFKPLLKKPHDLEYEKTFWPFILLSKKRYVGNLYEMDDVNFKQKSMGIVLKRRDNANIVKKIFGGIIDIILNEQDINKSIQFLKDSLQMMVDGKCDINDLIVTKSLRADSSYKDPGKIAHKVLAERIGERDPGNKPQVNDRLPYVFIQVDSKTEKKTSKDKVLQKDRIEIPDYVKKNNLKIDYHFYITHQIMQPILQLYALVLEQIPEFHNLKKPLNYYEMIKRNITIMFNGDIKTIKDKYFSIRENDVKVCLFDPYLEKIEGKKIRQSRVAEKYFDKNLNKNDIKK